MDLLDQALQVGAVGKGSVDTLPAEQIAQPLGLGSLDGEHLILSLHGTTGEQTGRQQENNEALYFHRLTHSAMVSSKPSDSSFPLRHPLAQRSNPRFRSCIILSCCQTTNNTASGHFPTNLRE